MKTVVLAVVLSILLLPSFVSAANILRGSPASQARQNNQADREKLIRLTENNLEHSKKRGALVRLPREVAIDNRLPEKYRWCRPKTRHFLVELAKDFEQNFGRPIQVNSAVRTVEYQKRLRKKNRNGASALRGPLQSSHLTGATIDIAKKGMSRGELRWMRDRLIALEQRGLIEATEEFHQLVFHVMVYEKYADSH